MLNDLVQMMLLNRSERLWEVVGLNFANGQQVGGGVETGTQRHSGHFSGQKTVSEMILIQIFFERVSQVMLRLLLFL